MKNITGPSTRKSQPPVNHVFVDLENVKTIDGSVVGGKNLTFHLILGPQNKKPDVDIVETLLAPEPGAALECGIGSNFCLGAPGRMPGPRGAGILPAACNSQVSQRQKEE